MSRSSIPVTEETREELSELRGDEYKNWDAFLKALAATYKGKGFAKVRGYGSDEILDVFEDPGLPKPPGAVDTDKILDRIDDLEASLPRKVAEELSR